MTIQEVKNIQIYDFLTSRGYKPINKKGNNWWYLSPLHSERTASFKVDISRNLWYDFGLGKGGNILALAMELYNTQDVSEVLRLMSQVSVVPIPPVVSTKAKESNSFEDVEVKELTHTALLNYLLSRGINPNLAKSQCKEIHYTSNGKKYFAIGFKNNGSGYELRNPYFKGCIAPKAITTITNNKPTCHVFEGFIDYLSYFTLHGSCDAVVLNSIVNIPHTLPVLATYSHVVCHLDNDAAGGSATKQIMEVLGNKCIDAANEYEGYKDLNEYLTSKSEAPTTWINRGW